MSKRLLVIASALAVAFTTGCTRVDPGFGGIEVSLTGGDRGVTNTVLPTGYTFHGPNTEIYQFPLYTINYTFTADKTEGSPENEEFGIQSSEGLICTMDLGVSMSFQKDKLPAMYAKYRKGENEIRSIVVKNSLRDALNKTASGMTAEEIYSSRKVELLDKATAMVRADLSPHGIVIESISLIGGVRPPKAIVEALNSKVEATQKSQQRENELRTAEAEAKKAIAQATGEAEANRLREQTASPAVIELKRLENQAAWITKWDGKLPTTVAGDANTMMISGGK